MEKLYNNLFQRYLNGELSDELLLDINDYIKRVRYQMKQGNGKISKEENNKVKRLALIRTKIYSRHTSVA